VCAVLGVAPPADAARRLAASCAHGETYGAEGQRPFAF